MSRCIVYKNAILVGLFMNSCFGTECNAGEKLHQLEEVPMMILGARVDRATSQEPQKPVETGNATLLNEMKNTQHRFDLQQ